MKILLLLILVSLFVISGCSSPGSDHVNQVPGENNVPPDLTATESLHIINGTPEKTSFPAETKASEPADTVPLYPGAAKAGVPDDLQKGFSENQLSFYEGYSVQAGPDAVMTWYRENMIGWQMHDDALRFQSYRKNIEGCIVISNRMPDGRTLLVLAEGSWPNVECCLRQIFHGPGGEENTEPSKDRIAETPLTLENVDDVVIVSSPVKLSQVEAISKFRSGAGHWYSGSNFLGEEEPPSNMKHYVEPAYTERDRAEVFAPFDGEIIKVEQVERNPGVGGGAQFFIEQRPYKGWVFGFCHVNMTKGLQTGSRVSAGEFLGYAMVEQANDFDLSLQGFKEQGVYRYATQETYTANLDSIFNHMSPEVYQQFAGYGFTKENMIVSREERQNNPLVGDGQPNTTAFYFISKSGDLYSENFVSSNIFQNLKISLPFSEADRPYEMMPMGETINHPVVGHPGIDFMWNSTVDITACADGTVVRMEISASHNKWDVYVRTGDFIIGYTTLEKVDEKIQAGNMIMAGQKIGEPGYFGHYMIHWEIKRDLQSQRFCPMSYLEVASRQRLVDIWDGVNWPEMKGPFPHICNGNFRCNYCIENGY